MPTAANQQQKKDDKANATLKKYLEKYQNDPEAFATAMESLEKKLGSQGDEVGTLRKQLEQQSAYLQQATPILQWYNQNHAALPAIMEQARRGAMLQQQLQQGQYQPQGQGQHYNQQQQHAFGQNQQGVTSLLTQDEQNQLINLAVSRIQEQALNPWMQQVSSRLDQTAMQKAKAVEDSLLSHVRSNSDVLWRTLEQVLPQEQIEKAKAWHQESLKYADPRNIDPMKMAQDQLGLRSSNERLERELKEAQEKLTAKEKEEAGLLTGGPNRPFSLNATLPAKDDTRPRTKDDRMSAVLTDVQTQHGNDGLKSLFS